MKNLLILCCVFTVSTINGQSFNSLDGNGKSLLNPWGTWGIGNISNQNTLDVFKDYKIDGYHLYYHWSELEPQKSEFNWSAFDDKLKLIADKNLRIGIQVMVGQNSPEWIYNNVPKVITTDGNDPGPYPYYFDTNYQKRYFKLLSKVAKHLADLPFDIKKHLVYWQICEGSTGDEQPYKGTPVNAEYAINYYDWQDYRHRCWDSVNKYAGNKRYYRFLFNTGNLAQDLQYVRTKYPGDFHKEGFLSHQYSFDGEFLYYSRQIRDINETFFRNRSRGEVQGMFNYPWWKQAPVKQAFTLACSALSGGLDMFNIGTAYINATMDTRPTEFFKKYAGLRKTANAKRGFIALRDVPDFADILRFPVEQYGTVIDPERKTGYDVKVAIIKASERDSASYKYWKIMQLTKQYLNPARRDSIINEFTSAGAKYTDGNDMYHDDFGINMTINFARFVRQVFPNSTSFGAWRIGEDSSMYGRYARLCRLDKNNHGEMFFRLKDSLISDSAQADVQLTIVYYDTGNGMWSVHGSDTSFKVANQNSNGWKQQTITFKHFKKRKLLNNLADFSLRYEGGTNTPFTLIEVAVDDAQDNNAGAIAQIDPAALDVELFFNPGKNNLSPEPGAANDEKHSVFTAPKK